MSSFQEGWKCRNSPRSVRISLARGLANHLATKFDWEGSSTLLEEAVELLRTVSLRSLRHTDKQYALVGDSSSVGQEENRRWKAENCSKEMLVEIRSERGFQNFLLPPTEDELKMAASSGPIVVVNVSLPT
ncbi:hypothetical protein BU25DRAFT_177426 [Macroventuria anomochaeta]|uniref:Uncharacterized protein n=1 Tax=Macroventuria anomochaeta TaxID=301207 RepID=A0ACB6RN12_9PLEO|nr:uncharacterized protein BU25DRAFT_177426 [Macroventuria anomochaeta]KAF2623330.1 hypothetical protein BU25DRAFT_177426 [Macroventuria anomochaeta]